MNPSTKLRARKSLGQHWLTSESALKAIIETAEIKEGETVLEIGPGQGVLTAALLEAGAKVIAVEKDRDLIADLNQKFATQMVEPRLVLLNQDIREFDPRECRLPPLGYKLVANIPYYLTGEILRQFLSSASQPSKMVVLVQKEVAERIVAKDGKESILSISVKAYGTPRYVKKVPAGAFNPPPKVDSAIIAIENISKKNFSDQDSEKKFFKLVKLGFGSKRKMLKNNLKLKAGELEQLGIPTKARAENLNLETWLKLSR